MLNTQKSDEERKLEEVEFFSTREKDRQNLTDEEYLKKYSNKRIYAIAGKSRIYLRNWLKENCRGKKVLDYCCGLGDTSLILAQYGANVYGIDISDESVETTKGKLAEGGFSENSFIEVMDAENMKFESNKFDVIVCIGVLHHLELKHAWPELARVLKPGGKIIAQEALGYNPFIRLYRTLTPSLRTSWEADHILTLRQVNSAKKFLGKANVRFFHLASILAIPFQRFFFFKTLLAILDGLDSIILRIPLVQLMAWQMVFILSEPLDGETSESGR